MKKYISVLKKIVFEDYINLYLISASVLIFVINYLIWRISLVEKDIFIQSLGGLYPIKYLLLAYIINGSLALFSYEKEKEIGYLLFSANLFLGILVLILEIFYLISLGGYA